MYHALPSAVGVAEGGKVPARPGTVAASRTEPTSRPAAPVEPPRAAATFDPASLVCLACAAGLAALGYGLLVAWLAFFRFPYLELLVRPRPARRGMIVSALVHCVAVVALGVVVVRPDAVGLPPKFWEISHQAEDLPIASETPVGTVEVAAEAQAFAAFEDAGPPEMIDIQAEGGLNLPTGDENRGFGLGLGLADQGLTKSSGDATGEGDAGDEGDDGSRKSTFFGTTAYGTKFVFIIDKSGSMDGSAFYRARGELLRSVKQLRSGQEFSMVFYSSDAVPFSADLVPMSKKAYSAAFQWVGRISPGGNTNPLSALRIALDMKPDAIFLLTDGEFVNPFDVVAVARQDTEKKIPIHTICFLNRVGEPVLREVSKVSKGTYRFVQ